MQFGDLSAIVLAVEDIAERFELAILRGELRNLYVNRVQVFLELCQLEFRLTNLRL